MSESAIKQLQKADIAFYTGFQNYRNIYRKEIGLHLFITLAFIIFIPIDATVLDTGNHTIPAEAVALAADIFSVISHLYMHYVLFTQPGLRGYCQLAKDTIHNTDQPLVALQTQQGCTSETVLDAGSGVLVAGVPEKTVNVYGNMAFYQITQVNEYKYNLSCWQRSEHLLGVSSIIIVIVLMATSDHMNAAEIAVLICYLVLQSFSKWKAVLITLFIVLSPLFLLVFCFWMCCCMEQRGVNALDLKPVAAGSEHVIKSDGECAICLMSINPGENVYQLPCSDKHIFHMGCLDKWTRVKVTCPICRKQLPMKYGQGPGPVQID